MGFLKRVQKIQPLQDPGSSPQSKKAKTFVVIGGNNGVVNMASLWSFMRTLDVSSYRPANSWPAVGATGMRLLQYYQDNAGWDDKGLCWIGTLLRQIPLRVGIVGQWECCLWLGVLESQSIQLAIKHGGTCAFMLVKTRENISLITKPSSHNTE